MPWLDANGLLPGRGWPGLGAGRGPGVGAPPWRAAGAASPRAAGAAPARVAGDGAGRAGAVAGAAGAALAAGAAGAAGAGAAGALAAGAGAAAAGAGAAGDRGCGTTGWGRQALPWPQVRTAPVRLRCGSTAGSRRSLGGRLGRDLAVGSGAKLRRERFLDLADDGGLDGRRRRPDELSLALQVCEQCLALDSELLGELVDPDLSHISPVLVRPEQEWPNRGLLLGLAHR